LPRVAEIKPATPGRSRFRRSAYTSPPRTLNAPIGVWFSCLTVTAVPSRCANAPIGVWFSCLTVTAVPSRCASSGHACAGVGGMAAATI